MEPDYLANLIAQHEANGTDLEICGHFVTYDDSERQHNPKAPQQYIARIDDILEKKSEILTTL